MLWMSSNQRFGGQHLLTLKRKAQHLKLECGSIACDMMGGVIGEFGVLVLTWNTGRVSGKGGEVCEELRKRMIDVCCLQEVR